MLTLLTDLPKRANPSDTEASIFLKDSDSRNRQIIEYVGRKIYVQTLYNILLAADGRLAISDDPELSLLVSVGSRLKDDEDELGEELADALKSVIDSDPAFEKP